MTDQPKSSASDDPGVPEALPRVLIRLRDRVGVSSIDRLWLFPPVKSGRRESGLIAASTYQDDGERRAVVTAAYVAEHTGRGVTIEPTFSLEGEAMPEHMDRVIQGVVRRGGEEKGEPKVCEVAGRATAFEELLSDFDAELLEAVLP